MTDIPQGKFQNIAIPAALGAAIVFLYATEIVKLGRDWWFDENYSHGLLVPFVIAFIVWKEWPRLQTAASDGSRWLGGVLCGLAVLLLFAGTLGAELFTARISPVVMSAGIIVYFWGGQVLRLIAVPFALLLLAIPIPQIVFNRIAFPLQIWASQMAVWGIRLFEVPTVRSGNVIDILPRGATQAISLEVVEACSGIRSLMTLVTLALILVYFTRRDNDRPFLSFSNADLWRAIVLIISAVPIAVLTNAARVAATGVMTYTYGKPAAEGTWHQMSGWLVYVVALALLIGVNFVLKKAFRGGRAFDVRFVGPVTGPVSWRRAFPLIGAMILSGLFINWLSGRPESDIPRRPLAELPAALGDWRQKGGEFRFDESIESVLRTTDFTMREYTYPDGRIANIYVGYYASQRTGATYHSPQNCLPGAGWVLSDPQYVSIITADGRTFDANRYIIKNGVYTEIMLYWYQGRGRIEPSEYRDKINTVWDSVTRRRSDGAIVRVMTDAGADEAASGKAAADLAARLAEKLPPFVPE
jgi:exosortase D (VPLPA-CTERM-specific)